MTAFADGFLREAGGSLTVTLSTVGAAYLDGFLRDSAGRLVVVLS